MDILKMLGAGNAPAQSAPSEGTGAGVADELAGYDPAAVLALADELYQEQKDRERPRIRSNADLQKPRAGYGDEEESDEDDLTHPALIEEAKKKLTALIRPEDLENGDEAETAINNEDARQIIENVLNDFKAAYYAKAEKEEGWFTCLAFERGNHFAEWDANQHAYKSSLVRAVDKQFFKSIPLIRPLILKNTARVNQTEPDVDITPLTGSDRDKSAARSARSIWAHLYRKLGIKQLVRDGSYGAQVTSTHFFKAEWDHRIEEYIPELDPQTGEVTGSFEARVGDVSLRLCLPFEILPDPQSRYLETARYIIHARLEPISELQAKYGQRYGKKGKRRGKGLGDVFDQIKNVFGIRASKSAGFLQDYESRLAAIAGDNRNQAGSASAGESRDDYALVVERFEVPTPKYPDGRWTIVTPDTVIVNDYWPYEHVKNLADVFVPLSYQTDFGSVWGRNLVGDLIDLQKGIDLEYSNLMSRVRRDKITILTPRGIELQPDAYTSERDYVKFSYNAGPGTPTYQVPPADWSKYIEAINFNISLMQDIAGVHDISQGKAPPGVKSGVALNVLAQADDTQISEFVSHLEGCLVRLCKTCINLYRQYATVPRLIGLDENGEPGERAMETFEAFQEGGQCSVVVTPGSAMPKTPAAKEEKLFRLLEIGMLGQPGTPEAVENFVDLDSSIYPDAVIERVAGRLRKAQEQAALAAQQQAEAEAAAKGAGGTPPEAQMAMEQQKMALQAQQEQAKSESRAREIELQAQFDNEQAENNAALEVDKAGAMAALEVQKAHAMPKPPTPAAKTTAKPKGK